MKSEKILNLFECVKEKGTSNLSPEILSIYRINSCDIFNFKEKGILRQTNQGNFNFYSKYMYDYLKEIRRRGNLDAALKCFLKFRDIGKKRSKKHKEEINYQIFKIYILKKEYETAFDFFKLIVHFNQDINYDNLLILILYDYLLELPADYHMLIDNIKVNMNDNFGKVIELCKSQKYDLALQELNKLENRNISDSKLFIIRMLLEQVIIKYNKLNNEQFTENALVGFINDKKILLNGQSVISWQIIYEILNFYCNYNVNIEIACLHFGLDVYQVNIVKLLIARQYYIEKDCKTGDLYYQSVINSEYQNITLKLLIDEIEDKEKLKNANFQQVVDITSKLSRKKNS